MLAARIQSLIDKRDTTEVVRDQIAAILLAESESQQALAAAAGKEPRLWALRVFTEASNPWEQFRKAPNPADGTAALDDKTPIANVYFDQTSLSRSGSNQSNRNTVDGTFQIDCYGYGISTSTGNGQIPGDASAAIDAQRAAKLVRNILASAHWQNLGLPGVGNRWVQSLQGMRVEQGGQQTQHVFCVRVTLNVNYPEFSPQYGPGETFEAANVQITRLPNGEVELFQFDASASP